MLATYVGTLRRFSRDLRLYLAAAALQGLVIEGINRVLLNLYMLRLGYGPEPIGLVNAVAAIVFTLSCLLAGSWTSRWGARRTLIAGMWSMSAACTLLPLAESVPAAWRVAWLAGTYAVAGLGQALTFVAGIPFLMAAAGPQERDHAFAAYAAVGPLSAVLGSLLGGALPGVLAALLGIHGDAPAAYGYPLWISALLFAVAALLLHRMGEVSLGRAAARRSTGQRPPYGLIAAIALIVVLRYAGNGAVVTFFNVYLDAGLGTSTRLIGALVAAGRLLTVPAVLATPLLVARWGRGRTIILGSLAIAFMILPMAFLPHWAAAGLGLVGVSALFAVTSTALRVYSQELVARSWRSAMSASLMTGAGLSASAIAFSGGYLIPSIGYSGLFALGAALTAAGATAFWVAFRVPRGELARAAGAGTAD